MTILVTGATGSVGRFVVRHLLDAGEKVRAVTRRPDVARFPEGVEVVAGDMTDAARMAEAFEGVTAAHLINFGDGYRPLGNGQEIVDAAVRAGIRRVTMLGGWEEGSLEPAVRASELEWTQLQPIEFMNNTLNDWAPRLRAEGVIREPYGGRKSAPVHESDIAAVAAVALAEGGHGGQAYRITGPEVLTPRDKIRILAEATGRDLAFVELTPEQTRREWIEEGVPPDLLLLQVMGDADARTRVEFLLRVYGGDHEIGRTVTDAVEKVTGRPALTFAQWAAENADAFLP